MFKEQIDSFKTRVGPQGSVILDLISQIEDERIDLEESRYSEENHFISISLKSNGDMYCPIEVAIGVDHNRDKVFVHLDAGVNVLYYEDIKNDDGLSDVILTLESLLKSRVQKDLLFVKDRLVEVVILCSELKYSDDRPIEFSLKKSNSWFWQKKQVESLFFEPWLFR